MFYAFLRRDIKLDTSYRLAFLLQAAGTLIFIAVFYFISMLVDGGDAGMKNGPGGGYFSFVLPGIIFYNFLMALMNGPSEWVRKEQLAGTLEAVLASPISPAGFIVRSGAWPVLTSFIETLIYFLISSIFFGYTPEAVDLPALVAVVLLSIGVFFGIGLISASFILRYKRGDPVNFLVNGIFMLIGGVFFPVSMLPDWLEKITYLFPVAYSLDALRACFSGSLGTGAHLAALFAFAAFLLPLGFISFTAALRATKEKGELSHY